MEAKTNQKSVLKSLMLFLSNSGSREKVFRLIQYFCKFLLTRYEQQYQTIISERDAINRKSAKISSLGGAAGMSRKILRFGPSISTVKTIILNLKAIADGRVKQPLQIHLLKTLSAFFVGLFFICDHYAWLFKMGLVSNQRVRQIMEYWSFMGFFLDCITNIIKNIILLARDRELMGNTVFLLDFSRVIADFFVSYSFVKPGKINGKTVGLLGTYTSLVGIYNLWK